MSIGHLEFPTARTKLAYLMKAPKVLGERNSFDGDICSSSSNDSSDDGCLRESIFK